LQRVAGFKGLGEKNGIVQPGPARHFSGRDRCLKIRIEGVLIGEKGNKLMQPMRSCRGVNTKTRAQIDAENQISQGAEIGRKQG